MSQSLVSCAKGTASSFRISVLVGAREGRKRISSSARPICGPHAELEGQS